MFQTNQRYWEDSRAEWLRDDSILNVFLGSKATNLGRHAALIMPNIDQLVFGLDAAAEVQSLEAIGASFDEDVLLKAPTPARTGILFCSIASQEKPCTKRIAWSTNSMPD